MGSAIIFPCWKVRYGGLVLRQERTVHIMNQIQECCLFQFGFPDAMHHAKWLSSVKKICFFFKFSTLNPRYLHHSCGTLACMNVIVDAAELHRRCPMPQCKGIPSKQRTCSGSPPRCFGGVHPDRSWHSQHHRD